MAQGRRIVWFNVVTVLSAAILIGAEVFGAAFAGSWALATLFDLGGLGARVLDGLFVALRHRHHGAVHPQRAPHRAVHRARVSAAAKRERKNINEDLRARELILLHRAKNLLFQCLPKFARACGRVSVGR